MERGGQSTAPIRRSAIQACRTGWRGNEPYLHPGRLNRQRAMTSRPSHEASHSGSAHSTIQRTFEADFACVACANGIERALRAIPHVTGVRIDYPARQVTV